MSPIPHTVGEAGEHIVLERILRILPEARVPLGPGDDAAVLATPDGRVVITNDTMIEGPDFRAVWSGGADLGAKAVATNLADIAAMGAAPTGLVIALVLPEHTPLEWVEDFARGVASRADGVCPVLGGDLATGPVRMISVTALGDLSGRQPVRRDGARAGDRLALAGSAGRAAAGLHLLFAVDPDSQDPTAVERLRGAGTATALLVDTQLTPRPPLGAGPVAAEAGATAMLDVSDGLLLDAARMGRASGLEVVIDTQAIASCVDRLVDGLAPVLGVAQAGSIAPELALRGGEDHALLAAFPPTGTLPPPFRVIGELREGEPGVVIVDGASVPPQGWDPFAHVEPETRRRG